ncbi:bulb-type lectin domain-containing protein [Tanacetum coccineum]
MVARLQVLIQALIMKIKRLRWEETPRIVGDDSARSEPMEAYKGVLKKRFGVSGRHKNNNNESRNNWKVCFGTTESETKEFWFGVVTKTWYQGSQDVLGELPPVIGVIKIDLLGLYKFVDDLGGYMNVSLDNKWNEIAKLLGLAQENQEAVKECYKEYIGMAKRYYEGAKRSKQEKPEDVDDAKVEGSNSVWTTDNNGEEYTSSFIEDIKASRTKKLRKEDFGITTLGRNSEGLQDYKKLIQVLIMKIKRLRRQETPRIVGDDSAQSEPMEVADSNDFKPRRD